MRDLVLPPSYHVADQASLAGQRTFVRSIRVQLSLLLVAGVASAVSWKTGGVDTAALVAGVAFVIAASLRFKALSTSPHQCWYEGRAAAESIKTLFWRFSVGGLPFPMSVKTEDAAATYLDQVREIAEGMTSIPLAPSSDDVTPTMTELRATELHERKATYLEARIDDQERWYAAKSQWNADRAKLWSRITLGAESVGAIGAFLVGFDVIDVDLFGLAGAAAAVAAAWLETKQHHSLASAYGVAASELKSIATLLSERCDEEEWARRVSDSEEAISREHTLWRARVSRA